MKIPYQLVLLALAIVLCSCKRLEQSTAVIPVEIIVPAGFTLLDKIVSEIAIYGIVESESIYYSGKPSDQWKRYEQLFKIATTGQLIGLTDHKSPAVRSYSFLALAEKDIDRAFPVLLNHLKDTVTVEIQNGCIGGKVRVGDYLIQTVRANGINPKEGKLTKKQRCIIDSILIHDRSVKLSAKFWAIKRLQNKPENYNLIRKLVEKDRSEPAVILLASYKNQNDRSLILSFFEKEDTQIPALYAAIAFPEECFYSYIKNVFENEWKEELYDYSKWKACFQALARYPKQETLDLFNRVLNSKDEFRNATLSKYLLMAITKYPDKRYGLLKQKIKLDDYDMNAVEEEVEASE